MVYLQFKAKAIGFWHNADHITLSGPGGHFGPSELVAVAVCKLV